MHSKLISPSGSHRWMNCTGSPAFIASLPPEQQDTGGPAARRGTAIHQAFAEAALASLSGLPYQFPSYFDVEGERIPIDKEAKEIVHFALKHLWAHPAFDNGKVWIEQKVPIGKIWGLDDEGTADIVMLTPDELTIWDLKTGQRPIPADSWQNRMYAIGAIADPRILDPTKPECRTVRRVSLGILQPSQSLEPVVETFPMDVLLDNWIPAVTPAIEKIRTGNGELVAGEWCRYCPGSLHNVCPAVKGRAVEALAQATAAPAPAPAPTGSWEDQAPVQVASVENIPELAEAGLRQDPEQMSPEDYARVLDAKDVVVGWFNDVEKVALRKLKEHMIEIPGWKLVNGRGSRKWTMPPEELEKKLQSLSFNKRDFTETKILSVAQLEKLAKTKLSDRRMKKFNALWEKERGKAVLAPASDPRPDFSEIREVFEDLAKQPGPEPVAPEKDPWEL